MGIFSRNTARSFYSYLRSATLEALEQVTAPGDDLDRRFGLRFGDTKRGSRLEPGNFHLMLASAELEHERFTMLVLGCGHGRLLLLAARHPWRRLCGVERSTEACWAAEHNLRVLFQRTGWQREAEVTRHDGELADFPLPRGPLALLLDGCGAEETAALRDRLERDLRAEPRECAVFASPEQAVVLARSGFLRRWREGDGWSCLWGRAEHPRSAGHPVEAEPTRAPRWEMQEGPEPLAALAPEWDALAHRSRGSVVADSIWVRSWCEAFLREGDRLEVHSLRQPADGRLLALLPLRLEAGRLASTRSSLLNSHHPFWSFAVDEGRPEAMRSLLAHLLQTRAEADLVELPRLHRGGFACESLLDAAEALGLRYQLVPDGADMFLRMGPWRELERRLPSNVRKHVPRKLRRLRERGELGFSVTTGGAELARDLRECYELEARGWKGVSGSPIQSRPETLRFYTVLAERAAERGRFALYLLRLDGRIIAFEYCLRGEGRIQVLKLSYDPEHGQQSPGQVLRLLLLEHEAGLGEIASYHMGLPGVWQNQWASGRHPLATLRVFAPSLRARAIGAGPALSSSLKLAIRGRPRLFSVLRWGRAQVTDLRARIAVASATP